MIIDRIENWREYVSMDPRFWPGFLFITERFKASMADGRYEFAGGYANVQSYTTAPAETKQFEAHQKYIDIQFILSGAEIIQWAPVADLKVTQPYSDEKDAAFLEGPKDVTQLVLTPGYFAIFFPSDAHKPCCSIAAPVNVRKIVAKIRRAENKQRE